jgi:hypothetical protein
MSIIELLEALDGYGIIFEDENLVADRLEDLNLDGERDCIKEEPRN